MPLPEDPWEHGDDPWRRVVEEHSGENVNGPPPGFAGGGAFPGGPIGVPGPYPCAGGFGAQGPCGCGGPPVCPGPCTLPGPGVCQSAGVCHGPGICQGPGVQALRFHLVLVHFLVMEYVMELDPRRAVEDSSLVEEVAFRIVVHVE